MSNVLTGLIPTIYEALDVVSREQIGMIPAVLRSTQAERAALGQVISWPVVPPQNPADIAPAATGPVGDSMTVAAPQVTISKSRSVTFFLTGEEQRGLRTGASDQIIVRNAFSQAMRALTNEVELDLANAGKNGASRAVGTAGTTPFGTANDLTDLASAMRVLDDNGAPNSGRRMILNTAAALNLRARHATALGAAGSEELLRTGSLGVILGALLGMSAGLGLHTRGTGASYVTSGATAVGVMAIALVTGTGTVVPGDVVTFAADAINRYVVNVGISAPGTIQIGRPGARVIIPTTNAMTIGNNYTPNLLFSEDAIALAVRAPAVPEGGDSADDAIIITDPVSGLLFEVRVYSQYRRVAYEIGLAWGVAAVKQEHIAILMG